MPAIELEESPVAKMLQARFPKVNLIERLTFLQDAITIGKGHVIVGQIIFDLVDYAHEKYSSEDDPLARYLYPEIERWNAAHREFRGKVEYYYYCFQMGIAVNPFEVATYLHEWIEDYLEISDM